MKKKGKAKTYILHDTVRDIYKIGKSTNPYVRLKKLCVLGEIEPIKIFDDDLEAKLHAQFKDYRINHPLYKDGGTEWFRYGGTFKKYIDQVKREEIPFYTPHSLYQAIEDENNLEVDTKYTLNALAENEYYRYILGKKILLLLGYLYFYNGAYSTNHPGVAINGMQVYISTRVMNEVIENYKIYLVSSHFDNYMAKAVKGKVFLRKVGALPNTQPVYLVVSALRN